MQIEFISNASFLFTLENGTTLLTDPWYIDGAYYGTWYNYPPLSADQRCRYLALQPDYLYISHAHPDHLHLPTLCHYPARTPVIIGKLAHDHLARKLRSVGFTELIEVALNEWTPIGAFEAMMFGPFASSSENVPDDVAYELDTSLLLRADGSVVFNNVDNTIQKEDAEWIARRFGPIDVAILPYSGASMYPQAFAQYSGIDKTERKDRLRERMLDRFIALSRAAAARVVVPAAGSYVFGGAVADYTEYMHQATPSQVESAWEHAEMNTSQLRFMATGDRLDARSGKLVEPLNHSSYRKFSAEARLAYARESRLLPVAHEEMVLPGAFEIPWDRLMRKARTNLWHKQQELDVFPACDMFVTIDHLQPLVAGESNEMTWLFSASANEMRRVADREGTDLRQHDATIVFRVDYRLMMMLLVGGAIWNNAEIGSLITVDLREPDRFDPTLHSLMSYFML